MALGELESNYQMTLEALVAALDSREHETLRALISRRRAYTRYLARRAGFFHPRFCLRSNKERYCTTSARSRWRTLFC